MTTLQMTVLALALAGPGEGQTVLLDFSAPWCGPCQQMAPVVGRLEEMGYPVRRVDFDRQRGLADRFGVDRIPCFVMLVDGREVGRTLGVTSTAELERLCRLGRKPRRSGQPDVPTVLASMPGGGAVPIAIPAQRSAGPLAMGSAGPGPSHDPHTNDSAAATETNRPGPAPDPPPAVRDNDLLAATVRLRVYDAQGPSLGTGTIVDARDGMALILTCGHIFRDYDGTGRIEVDLFGPEPVKGIPGHVLSYDDKRDVGLLFIRAPGPVRVARVAPRGYTIGVGDTVANVGCNHGGEPTLRHNRVSAIDKYLGPPNVEVGGLPVQGRSGGGLFSAEGYVIGVCNAADPQDDEGLYAAVSSIHAELEKANLAYVLEGADRNLIAQAPLQPVAPPQMAKTMPAPETIIQRTTDEGAPLPSGLEPAALGPEEQAALSEIRHRQAQGAEVICIIRSRAHPDAPSEVLVLDQVSPEFLRRLASGQPKGAR